VTAGGGEGDRGFIEGGSAAVLRAIGSLLVALSGSEQQAHQIATGMAPALRPEQRRTTQPPAPEPDHAESEAPVSEQDRYAPREPAASQPPRVAPPEPAYRGLSGEDDEIEFLLTDARVRAQEILDESMEKARELMEQRAGGVNTRVLSEIRTSVTDLVDGMTEVRHRLARIEQLIEEYRAPAGSGTTEPAAAARPAEPPQPTYTGPERRGTPSDAPSAFPPPSREAMRAARPPFSVVPPAPPREPTERDSPGEASGEAAAASAGSLDEFVPEPRAATPVPSAGPDATFQPEHGSLLLRVSPVAGFQGLMRVQDALGRLGVVRQATVEAYAHGEARLRIELSSPVAAGALAAGLADSLGEFAQVRELAEVDRSILVTLG
jgi:hypothetical protein